VEQLKYMCGSSSAHGLGLVGDPTNGKIDGEARGNSSIWPAHLFQPNQRQAIGPELEVNYHCAAESAFKFSENPSEHLDPVGQLAQRMTHLLALTACPESVSE
jgi:hypothetical protein